MVSDDEYGRRTLDFVGVVTASMSSDEIWSLAKAELAWYGLDFVTVWYVPSPGESLSETVSFNSRPQDYVQAYNDRALVAIDPVVTEMRSTHSTLSWGDVRDRRRLVRRERHILDEAIEFGADDGLTIPVLTSSGYLGVVSPCGRRPNLTPRARSAVEMVCLYTHQALQRHVHRNKSTPTGAHQPLTPREREIMRWVAVGKTNNEIGSILGIAGATVKTLLARAQFKLDAYDRTFAVVQAIRTGELDLNF